jgi:hypothetical protein
LWLKFGFPLHGFAPSRESTSILTSQALSCILPPSRTNSGERFKRKHCPLGTIFTFEPKLRLIFSVQGNSAHFPAAIKHSRMKLNKFDSLSYEDKQFIITLCQNHTYIEAVQILAQPKPEGLDFQTSPAALCRFYTAHSELNTNAELADLLTQTLHHATPGAALLTILAAVENHILVELSRGKSITDLDPHFKQLTRLHRLHLANENLKLKQANLVPQQPKPRQPDFTRIEQPASQQASQPTTQPSAEPASNSLPLSLADLDVLEKMLDEAMKNSDSFRNNPPNPSVIPQIPLKNSSPAEQSAYENVLKLLQSYEQASA